MGTLEQKERFLTRFADSKAEPAWGAMAMTEPGAGSDTSAIATTAALDEETNEWVLNGEKIFCTSATQITPGSTKKKTGQIFRKAQNSGPRRACFSSFAAKTRCTIVWSLHQYHTPRIG